MHSKRHSNPTLHISPLPTSWCHSAFCYNHASMATIIDSLAKCELRNVIRFLQTEGNSVAEIHRIMLCRVYGKNFMSDGVVRE